MLGKLVRSLVLWITFLLLGCQGNHPLKNKELNSALPPTSSSQHHGIYINKSTMLNTSKLNHLMQQAQSHNIDTFIVDLSRQSSSLYENNVKKIQSYHIQYVPRIVIFPEGGTHEQIEDRNIWQRHWPLVKYAIKTLHAQQIQFDYIRYRADSGTNINKRHHIHKVIKWYNDQIKSLGAQLQIAVFGITAFHPSHAIGQDIALFADDVDVICPMVYPSHFEPFVEHAKQPYNTVRRAMIEIKSKIKQHNKIIPYLELSNYRVSMTALQRLHYTQDQIKAASDSNTSGWYFWSANNYYDTLFQALETHRNITN